MSERIFRSLVAKGRETYAGYTLLLNRNTVELTVSDENANYVVKPSTDIKNLPNPVVKMVKLLDKYYTNNYIFRLTSDNVGVYRKIPIKGHETLVHPRITEDATHFNDMFVCATPNVYSFNLWFKDKAKNLLRCKKELIVSIYRDIEVITARSGRQCMVHKNNAPFITMPYNIFYARYGKY